MDQPEDAPTQPPEYYRRKAADVRRAVEGVTTRAIKARLDDLAGEFDRLAGAAEGSKRERDPLAVRVRPLKGENE